MNKTRTHNRTCHDTAMQVQMWHQANNHPPPPNAINAVLFCFSETGFHCVALAVLEIAL
jgi:hypothetical protein